MQPEPLQIISCTISEADVRNADQQHAAWKAGKYIRPQTTISRCTKLKSFDDGSHCPEPQALENQTQARMHGKTWKSYVKEADETDATVSVWLAAPKRPFSDHLTGQLDYAQRPVG